MLFGSELGLPGEAIVPVTLILLMVPAVILVANAVAFWPARTVSRLSAAEVLRTE
jgi:ABC-type antimicrobial peptide transport system permease subunit